MEGSHNAPSEADFLAWLTDSHRNSGFAVSPTPPLRWAHLQERGPWRAWSSRLSSLDIPLDYEPRSLSISPCKGRVALGTKDGQVYAFEWRQSSAGLSGRWERSRLSRAGSETSTRDGAHRAVRVVTFLDSHLLLIGSGDGCVEIVDLREGAPSHPLSLRSTPPERDPQTRAPIPPSGPTPPRPPDRWFRRFTGWVSLVQPLPDLAAALEAARKDHPDGSTPRALGFGLTPRQDVHRLSVRRVDTRDEAPPRLTPQTGALQQEDGSYLLFSLDYVHPTQVFDLVPGPLDEELPSAEWWSKSARWKIVGGAWWRYAAWILTDQGHLLKTWSALTPGQLTQDGRLKLKLFALPSTLEAPQAQPFSGIRASWNALALRAGSHLTVLGTNHLAGWGLKDWRGDVDLSRPLSLRTRRTTKSGQVREHGPHIPERLIWIEQAGVDFTLFQPFLDWKYPAPTNADPLWIVLASDGQGGGISWLPWSTEPEETPNSGRSVPTRPGRRAASSRPLKLRLSKRPGISFPTQALKGEILVLEVSPHPLAGPGRAESSPSFFVFGTREQRLQISTFINLRKAKRLIYKGLSALFARDDLDDATQARLVSSPGVRLWRAQLTLSAAFGLGPRHALSSGPPRGWRPAEPKAPEAPRDPGPHASHEPPLLPQPPSRESRAWLQELSLEDVRRLARYMASRCIRTARQWLYPSKEKLSVQTEASLRLYRTAVLDYLDGSPSSPLDPAKPEGASLHFITAYTAWSLALLTQAHGLEGRGHRGALEVTGRILTDGILRHAQGDLAPLLALGEIIRKFVVEGPSYGQKSRDLLHLAESNLQAGRGIDALIYGAQVLLRRMDTLSSSSTLHPETGAGLLGVASAPGAAFAVQSHQLGELSAIDNEGRQMAWRCSVEAPPRAFHRRFMIGGEGTFLSATVARDYREAYQSAPLTRALWVQRVGGEAQLWVLIFATKAFGPYHRSRPDWQPTLNGILFRHLPPQETGSRGVLEILDHAQLSSDQEIRSFTRLKGLPGGQPTGTPPPAPSNAALLYRLICGTDGKIHDHKDRGPKHGEAFVELEIALNHEAPKAPGPHPEEGEAARSGDNDRAQVESAALRIRWCLALAVRKPPVKSLSPPTHIRGATGELRVRWGSGQGTRTSALSQLRIGQEEWLWIGQEDGRIRGFIRENPQGATSTPWIELGHLRASDSARMITFPHRVVSRITTLKAHPLPAGEGGSAAQILAYGLENGALGVILIQRPPSAPASEPITCAPLPGAREEVWMGHVIHTQEQGRIISLCFYEDTLKDATPGDRSLHLMGVSQGGSVATYDLSFFKRRPGLTLGRGSLALPPPAGTRLDHFSLGCTVVSALAASPWRPDRGGMGMLRPPASPQAAPGRPGGAQPRGGPPTVFWVGCEDGVTLRVALVAPKQSQRRADLTAQCEALMSPTPMQSLTGTPLVACLSSAEGLAALTTHRAALPPPVAGAPLQPAPQAGLRSWLRVMSIGSNALQSIALTATLRESHSEVASALEGLASHPLPSASASFESATRAHRALIANLSASALTRHPAERFAVKEIWSEGARTANLLSAAALRSRSPSLVRSLLKEYLEMQQDLESLCKQWAGRRPGEAEQVLMHAFQHMFDWTDILLMAARDPLVDEREEDEEVKGGATAAEGEADLGEAPSPPSEQEPTESGGTIQAQICYHLLKDRLYQRLLRSSPLVALETLSRVNIALAGALYQHWGGPRGKAAPLRIHRKESNAALGLRIVPEWQTEGGLFSLMTLVGDLIRYRGLRLQPSSPLYSEAVHFFARCLLLLWEHPLLVGMAISRAGIPEVEEGKVARRIADHGHLLLQQLKREFDVTPPGREGSGPERAIALFDAYLSGDYFEEKPLPEIGSEPPPDIHTNARFHWEYGQVEHHRRALLRFEGWRMGEGAAPLLDPSVLSQLHFFPRSRVCLQGTKAETARDEEDTTDRGEAQPERGPLELLGLNAHRSTLLSLLSQLMDAGYYEGTRPREEIERAISALLRRARQEVIENPGLCMPHRQAFLEVVTNWEDTYGEVIQRSSKLIQLLDRYGRHVQQASADRLLLSLADLSLDRVPLDFRELRGHQSSSLKHHLIESLRDRPRLKEVLQRGMRLVDHGRINSALLRVAVRSVHERPFIGRAAEGPPPPIGETDGLRAWRLAEIIADEVGVDLKWPIPDKRLPLGGSEEVWQIVFTETFRNIQRYGTLPDRAPEVHVKEHIRGSKLIGISIYGLAPFLHHMDAVGPAIDPISVAKEAREHIRGQPGQQLGDRSPDSAGFGLHMVLQLAEMASLQTHLGLLMPSQLGLPDLPVLKHDALEQLENQPQHAPLSLILSWSPRHAG